MRYLSLFSGVEAAALAWQPLGWECVGVAEIDPFCCKLLSIRHPDIPNLGDVEKITKEQIDGLGPIDLVIFGSPCQSFSIAGKRLGLDDSRGNLALVSLRIISWIRPKYWVFENVPGLLSSAEGRDFRDFLATVAELGDYGCSWRVLDAQYTKSRDFPRAVPQRRRRVFVVGSAGDYRRSAAILFDSQSMSGNPPPSRKTGQGTTQESAKCLRSNSGGIDREDGHTLIPDDAYAFKSSHYTRDKDGAPSDVCPPLTADADRGDQDPLVNAPTLGFQSNGNADDILAAGVEVSPTMRVGSSNTASPPAVAVSKGYTLHGSDGTVSTATETDVAHALRARNPSMIENSTNTVVGQEVPAIAFKPGQSADAHSIGAQEEVACTLEAGGGGNNRQAIAFDTTQVTNPHNRSRPEEGDPCHTLAADGHPPAIAYPIHDQATRHAGKRDDKTDGKGNGLGIGSQDDPANTITAGDRHAVAFGMMPMNSGKDFKARETDVSQPLVTNGNAPCNQGGDVVVFDKQAESAYGESDIASTVRARDYKDHSDLVKTTYSAPAIGLVKEDNVSGSLTNNHGRGHSETQVAAFAASEMAVRRLTPVECERLMAMPDNYTLIPYNGRSIENAADGPRYKALGNSMAVNCIQWLGERIQMVDELMDCVDQESLPERSFTDFVNMTDDDFYQGGLF